MHGPTLLREHLKTTGRTARDLSRATRGFVGESELSRYIGRKGRPSIDHAHAIEVATAGVVPIKAWSKYRPRKRQNGS